MRQLRRMTQILSLCFALAGTAWGAGPFPPPAAPPLGEQWFRITVGDQRAGFARTTVRAVTGGYEVLADSSARMVVLGFSRKAASREYYLVNRDLSLKSFLVDQVIDGKRSQVAGEVVEGAVRLTVTEQEKKREKRVKSRRKIYPVPLLNLYPLMQGVAAGKKYRVQTIDPEEARLKEVVFSAVGVEVLPEGTPVVHLRNDLYPFVDNDIWVDHRGYTISESVRDGLVVTAAESADAGRQFLLQQAIAKNELILGFTTIPADREVARPDDVQRLTVEMGGIPGSLPLFATEGQKAERLPNGRVVFTVWKVPPPAPGPPPPGDAVVQQSPPTDELVALKNEIVGDAKEPVAVAGKLLRWVRERVEESPEHDLAPVAAARTGKGNSHSRVRLFAALARAAGVPTRTVSGLTSARGSGFIYHSWAECRAGSWFPVDPNLGQLPADATHIKLAEGERPEEQAPVSELVGRVTVKVLEEVY